MKQLSLQSSISRSSKSFLEQLYRLRNNSNQHPDVGKSPTINHNDKEKKKNRKIKQETKISPNQILLTAQFSQFTGLVKAVSQRCCYQSNTYRTFKNTCTEKQKKKNTFLGVLQWSRLQLYAGYQKKYQHNFHPALVNLREKKKSLPLSVFKCVVKEMSAKK